MPEPFVVIATQNPIEYEGTFPLPEAQLDRFMLRIALGYPSPSRSRDPRRAEAPRTRSTTSRSSARSTSSGDAARGPRDLRRPEVADYIVRLVNGTRDHGDIYLGASPRGSIALYRAGQALAGLLGRDYVIPDDVKALAEAALAHRLIIKTSSSIHDVQPAQVVRELLDTTPVGAVRETASRPRPLQA